MEISTNFFSSPHATFFQDNFSVEEASVDSFDKADIVLVGESHDIEEHRRKFEWLVKVFANPKESTILMEGIERNTTSYMGSAHPNVEIQGWDSVIETWKGSNRYYEQLENIIPILENCDIQNSSCSQLKVTAKKLIDLTNSYPLEEEIAKIQLYIKDFDECWIKYLEIINRSHHAITAPNSAEPFLKETTPESKIRKEFGELKYRILIRLFCLNCFANPYGTRFAERQASMVASIQTASTKKGKVFLLAGRSHLLYRYCSETPFTKKGIDTLKSYLNGKKYVILLPNKNKKEIEVVNTVIASARFSSLLHESRDHLSIIINAIALYLLPDDYSLLKKGIQWVMYAFVIKRLKNLISTDINSRLPNAKMYDYRTMQPLQDRLFEMFKKALEVSEETP